MKKKGLTVQTLRPRVNTIKPFPIPFLIIRQSSHKDSISLLLAITKGQSSGHKKILEDANSLSSKQEGIAEA